MPRSMVGLLTAVGTTMSALVPFAHGDLTWAVIAIAAIALGLAAYSALLSVPLPPQAPVLPLQKKSRTKTRPGALSPSGPRRTGPLDANYRRVPGRDELGR
jgi:hypothetical protein